MKRHLGICKPYSKARGQLSGLMNKYLEGADGKKGIITQNDLMDLLLKFFISGNIAFNQADNIYLRKIVELIKCRNEQTVKVNRFNITDRLHHSAEGAKNNLMSVLMFNEFKISLALNC